MQTLTRGGRTTETATAAVAGALRSGRAPFAAAVVCSGPATERLEVDRLVTVDANRWSAADEPTLYLAGDVGVALAEVGRHWAGDRRLCLWQGRLALAAAVDLRRQHVRAAAGIPDDPRWFLDRDRCREVAARFRDGGCDGLIVPSVAFLDGDERWNAVVFADRVASLDDTVTDLRPVGTIGYRA